VEKKIDGHDITLLVIGEPKDWDSYLKMCRNLRRGWLRGYDYVIETYECFETGLPRIDSSTVVVFLFFPHTFWNQFIECKGYKGLYGNVEFYQKFRHFWTKIHHTVMNFYADKEVRFINHPLYISRDRDKELTKTMLAEAGVNVPAPIFSRKLDEVLELVEGQGKQLYLKVRYGSMGKGITYMEPGKWETNFQFIDGKVANCTSEYDWRFADITGNEEFLRQLLRKDIVIEEAIPACLVGGERFDLRFYVFDGELLYTYARTNSLDARTNNISQGGRGRDRRFLRHIPARVLRRVENVSLRATKALALNLAGVDVMFSPDMKQTYVIELNAFPGYPSSKGFNLSKRILQVMSRAD